MSEELAEEVTGFHVHRGALASLERRPLPAVDEVLAGARTVLVLEDVVDHTNVGAIFRCGAAFGFDAVLLAPRCADPLYRRSVKVAMGAVFALPWTRLPDWDDALPSLSRLGFTTVALTLAADAAPVEDAVAGLDRVALVLGSEGHGLSRAVGAGRPTARATIPMAGGVDSLNVAAAAAVACYVTSTRCRSGRSPSPRSRGRAAMSQAPSMRRPSSASVPTYRWEKWQRGEVRAGCARA